MSEAAHLAREIGAGHLDQRVEPQSDDEFGALTEAFNNMASELATSRLKVEQTTLALHLRPNQQFGTITASTQLQRKAPERDTGVVARTEEQRSRPPYSKTITS